MNKKILITVLISIAVISIIFTACCIDSKPTYKIGLDPYFSPWEYVDAGKNPQGINIELMNLIAEDQNFNPEYCVLENSAVWLDELNNNKIDTIGGIVITPERQKEYNFVKIPIESSRYIVVTRGDTGTTLNDVMDGKASVAVFKNSVYENWLKDHFGEEYYDMLAEGKIILKDTIDEIIFSVLSKESDAAIAGSVTLTSQMSIYHPLTVTGYIGEPMELGFIIRKSDANLYNKINEGMKNIQSTPEFDAIIEKYNLNGKKNTYIVGVNPVNYPWTFTNELGEYDGFDVEMIEYIGEQEGFNVKYEPYTWNKNIGSILVGDVDMWASSLAITDERLDQIDFSDSYYTSGTSIGIMPDKHLTKSDFNKPDAKIVVFRKTTSEVWLKNYLGENKYNSKVEDGSIILAVKNSEVDKALCSGEADFVIYSEEQLRNMEKSGYGKVIFTDENTDNFAIGIAKSNTILKGMLNDGLKKFESSGKEAELFEKYGLN